MTRGAALLLTCLAGVTAQLGAQDSSDAVPAIATSALPIDSSRVLPYRHVYDMRVSTLDSVHSIGARVVALEPATYGGDSAWLLTEMRTGVVPTTDSLFLSPLLRPLHWSSALGPSHLGAEFTADSIYGVTTGPTGRQNIVLGGEPNLLVSGAMTEAVLAALPLALDYRDSVNLLAVTLTSAMIDPGELAVVGEEDVIDADAPQAPRRACWVVAVRDEEHQALYWIEKGTGVTVRVQQLLPLHDGDRLDYTLADSSGLPERP